MSIFVETVLVLYYWNSNKGFGQLGVIAAFSSRAGHVDSDGIGGPKQGSSRMEGGAERVGEEPVNTTSNGLYQIRGIGAIVLEMLGHS